MAVAAAGLDGVRANADPAAMAVAAAGFAGGRSDPDPGVGAVAGVDGVDGVGVGVGCVTTAPVRVFSTTVPSGDSTSSAGAGRGATILLTAATFAYESLKLSSGVS